MSNTELIKEYPLDQKKRGLFERPVESFNLDPRAVEWILADDANPLNIIAKLIQNNDTVLDIGAGNGILSLLLRQLKRDVCLDAIEPDDAARDRLAPLYREVYAQDLGSFLKKGSLRQYDYIVMADVVEHIANPEPLLRGLLTLLKPGGKIVLSTPNVSFSSVRLALLYGQFNYVDSGILERTHLRFYTRQTLLQLFNSIELNVLSEFHCIRNPLTSEIPLGDFAFNYRLLRLVDRDRLSRVYQFLFVLVKEQVATNASPKELGSYKISLPLAFLKEKIKSILQRIC